MNVAEDGRKKLIQSIESLPLHWIAACDRRGILDLPLDIIDAEDEGVDSGPIIVQSVVKVTNNDTEKTLSEKILAKEHKIYPEAVNLFARKKIRLSGRRVKILD